MQDLNLNSLIQNSLRPQAILVLKQATNQTKCMLEGVVLNDLGKIIVTFLILR